MFTIPSGYGKILMNAIAYHYGCFIRVKCLIFFSNFWRGFYGPCGYNTYSYGNIRIRYGYNE